MSSVESVDPRVAAAVGEKLVVAAKTTTSLRRNWKLIAVVMLGALLGVEVVLVAPYLQRAMSALNHPDLRWLALAVAAELLSMGAFARVQRRMLSAGGARVGMSRMTALTYAANAVSVSLPGGTALSSGYVFKRLRSWGATAPAAGFTILASGVLSVVSFALLAVMYGVVAGNGAVSSLLLILATGAVTIAVLATRRHRTPEAVVRLASRGLVRANRIMHRAPESGLASLHRLLGELSAIRPRSRDWLAGLGFAGLNWLADLACLVACCYAVGADQSALVLVTAAYLAGTSAASLSLLPGGLGVVDAAMIFALTQGGVSTVSATAAVLLYRLISFALIVALGWLVWGGTWLADRRPGGEASFTFSRTGSVKTQLSVACNSSDTTRAISGVRPSVASSSSMRSTCSTRIQSARPGSPESISASSTKAGRAA